MLNNQRVSLSLFRPIGRLKGYAPVKLHILQRGWPQSARETAVLGTGDLLVFKSGVLC